MAGDFWQKEAIFYHIYPLGMCGAPKENTFSAPVRRIEELFSVPDYLAAQGYNAVYIGPLFSSMTHGYDTVDYRTLDQRLGTNEDLKKLCGAFHEKGIRVVFDAVFHHVGRAFFAFRDLLEKKEESPYLSWFSGVRFDRQSSFGDSFAYDSWEGHEELVKLNLFNEETADYLFNVVLFWIDAFGVDGLRMDAANCMPIEFFERLRSVVKQKKSDFWLMGEVIHGDYRRWANDKALDTVTNYEAYKGLYSSHNDRNYFEIAHTLTRQFGEGGLYRELCLYNFVDNHDVTRLYSILKDKRHIFNVYTLLFTMPGIPSVYYGSEFGIAGEKRAGSDASLRPSLHIGDEAENVPGLRLYIRYLIRLRQVYTALKDGKINMIHINNEQLVYVRENEQMKILIALNLSETDAAVHLPYAINAEEIVKSEAPLSIKMQQGGGEELFFHKERQKTDRILISPCSSKIFYYK